MSELRRPHYAKGELDEMDLEGFIPEYANPGYVLNGVIEAVGAPRSCPKCPGVGWRGGLACWNCGEEIEVKAA